MKYMLIMRATDEGYASMANTDFNEMLETVGKFNEELIRAGVLLAAEGLADASEGVVVDFSAEPPVVTDGPYGETKELFGGFYLINVASKEEAVEWAKRLPISGPGFKAEIRRVPTIDEFHQDNESSRRSGRGARPPVSCSRAGRARARPARCGGGGQPWLTPPPGGTRSPPSGGSSRPASSAAWPGTPGTSRWPRTWPRRPWRRPW